MAPDWRSRRQESLVVQRGRSPANSLSDQWTRGVRHLGVELVLVRVEIVFGVNGGDPCTAVVALGSGGMEVSGWYQVVRNAMDDNRGVLSVMSRVGCLCVRLSYVRSGGLRRWSVLHLRLRFGGPIGGFRLLARIYRQRRLRSPYGWQRQETL